MFYKSAFLTIFTISLLLSACSDDSKVKSTNTSKDTINTPTVKSEDIPQAEKAEPEVKMEIPQNARLVIAEEGLRMRDNPTLDGEVVCVIPFEDSVILLEEKGEESTISGKTGKWSLGQWNEKKGWVFGGFLTKSITRTINIHGEEYEVELYKGTREELIARVNCDSKFAYSFESGRKFSLGNKGYTIISAGAGCAMEHGGLVFSTNNVLTFIPDTEPIASMMSLGPLGCERIIKEKTTFKIWTIKDNPDFVIFHSDKYILLIRNEEDEIKKISPQKYIGMNFLQALEMMNEDGVPYTFERIKSAKEDEGKGILTLHYGNYGLYGRVTNKVYLVMTKPDNIPEGKVFGLFKAELPDFIFYKKVEVIASSGEERTTLMSMPHPGGELSIPYILDENAEIVVLVDGKERIKEKVKAY
jgi:hypothetical protein